MYKLRIFRLLALLFSFSLFAKIDASVDSQINKISYTDQISLKFFFKELFLHDGLGHVLFFETKPVSMTGFYEKKNRPLFKHFFLNTIENIHDSYFKKGWTTWKKNESLFSHPNFIFAEDKTVFSDGEQICNIYVINKKTLSKCLKENELIFREILGKHFSTENFLEKLEKEKKILSLINNDECLLGILLGYGYESSLAFKNESIGLEQNNYFGINIAKPENCPIWPIGFMGNPNSKEVQNLVKNYENELKELNIKYQNSKDIFSLFLTQITK